MLEASEMVTKYVSLKSVLLSANSAAKLFTLISPFPPLPPLHLVVLVVILPKKFLCLEIATLQNPFVNVRAFGFSPTASDQ